MWRREDLLGAQETWEGGWVDLGLERGVQSPVCIEAMNPL